MLRALRTLGGVAWVVGLFLFYRLCALAGRPVYVASATIVTLAPPASAPPPRQAG